MIRRSRKYSAVLLLIAMIAWALPASASVEIENQMAASSSPSLDGLQIYRYGSGTDKVADFTTGTHDSTVETTGALELDLAGSFADWWDAAFAKRQCFDVTSADAESEYPLRFEVDTSGTSSTGADIRVVEGTTGTLLTSYSEGVFPSTTAAVWAQAEPLPAGTSTYCVYFDNPTAPSVSDEIGTFTYTTRSIEHYTLSSFFAGAGADSEATIVSYSNGNVVSDGTTTVTLNAGQSATFSGLNQHSIITSTGPIDTGSDRNDKEALVPEGLADSQFAFPTRRYVEQFFIRSPHGNTTVEAVSNGVVIGSVNVGPASGSVQLVAAGPGNQPVQLRTTNGLDIVAIHIATNGEDSMIGVPWFGDTLYGVASNNLNLGAFSPSTVSWVRSDGASNGAQAIATNALTALGGNGAFGNGRAYAIDGTTYFHAAQQADNDGTEVTSFLPTRLLNRTYRTPHSSRYFTIACPQPGTLVSINGAAAVPCNGTGVGHLYSGFGFHPAGTLIEADAPIFVYHEGSGFRNENNLFGAKSNIPYTTSVTYMPASVENQLLCGSWESAVLPTTGIHGMVSIDAATPAGTTATFQISTDGSSYYGPDGTATTSFADGDITPYAADNTTALRLLIELCTTDAVVTPTVTTFAVACDLDELIPDVDNLATMGLASPATGTFEPVLRIYQAQPGTWTSHLEYRGGAGLANNAAEFTTDHPTPQTKNSAGTVTDPQTTFSHQTTEPYTVFVEHKTLALSSATIELAVVADDTRRIESGVSITFVG